MTLYGSINSPSLSPSLPISPQKKIHHLTKAERDLLQSDRPGYGTRSKIEVAFNLVNATIGAGVIGLPFAIAHSGFFLGIIISIFVAMLSQLGLYMIVLAGQTVGIYKFATMVEYLLGKFGYHFLNTMIIIQAGGACISYFILLGDTVPLLLEPYLPEFEMISTRTLVVVVIAVCFILPLNLDRSIGSLARWSILSVLLFPIVLCTIIIRAPAYIPKEPVPITWVGQDVYGALGVFAFAFTCSQVAFNNYLTLEDQSSRSWGQTTTFSTSMSWFISMIFAFLGYFCFGDKVQPNLFMNFETDDVIINIGRFILGCTMILTIPLGFYPTREAVQKVLGFETNDKQPNKWQHLTVTYVLFFVLLFAGVQIRSLGKVYGLVGGISATTLAFILPAAAYLVTTKQHLFRRASTTSMESALTKTSTLYYHYTNNTGITIEDKLMTTNNFTWDVASTASSSRTPLFDEEEDTSTVNGGMDDSLSDMIDLNPDYIGKPNLFLDIAAVVLFIWGFVVMVLSVSSVLSQP
ncbi:transmembrane amino acid transporter protein-domain-containing protein [Cunninghamella echinulata]|nr:transmembrane amino acid transporter protein-domain-containing protein [Cunninghamella echinulata]